MGLYYTVKKCPRCGKDVNVEVTQFLQIRTTHNKCLTCELKWDEYVDLAATRKDEEVTGGEYDTEVDDYLTKGG